MKILLEKQNRIILISLVILGIGFSGMSYSIFELGGINSQPIAILFISGMIIGLSLGILASMPSKKKSTKQTA